VLGVTSRIPTKAVQHKSKKGQAHGRDSISIIEEDQNYGFKKIAH